jgi:type II secretory pathway pseudopilin PulG
MPIAYSCPHCGKQFSVAEQYAGQSGPCAACGKPITIPQAAPGAGYAYSPQAGSPAAGGGGLLIIIIAIVGSILVCAGIVAALVLPAVQATRQASRRTQSANNLKQIGLALHNYHDAYGTFPPAVVTDPDGKPLYSGRVLLLPFMEQEALYNEFDRTQAWDSPENLALSQTVVPVFNDPASPSGRTAQTDYLFVTGAGTVFEAGKATKIREITDGTSNTLLVVEGRNSGINWAEPRDFDISKPTTLPLGNHPGTNIVLMADGSVRFLSNTVGANVIRDLSTKDGNEMVSPP